MKRLDGFLPLDWDAKEGKLYLEIPRWTDGHTSDILYVHALPWGTGSNDLGLDRGQMSNGLVVRFERSGPKIFLVQLNEAFRSASSDIDQQKAVLQSFPRSILWGFRVEAESPDGSTVLVDATDFFLHDAHQVSERIAAAQSGRGAAQESRPDAGQPARAPAREYRLDASRSAVRMEDTKAFPGNIEVEAELTFTSSGSLESRYVSDVTPDPHAVTVRQRQSFVELPPLDGSFQPRRFNPRAGYSGGSYRDMTAPLGAPLEQRFIWRHRLIKKDPACVTHCEALHPIQYYVDRGAPEPIRSALREGVAWWDEAYQLAGWAKGTFRVDLLPEGADPMDVRYNVIQWVHRYTRGWSYGHSIVDPRTGEILKGNVTLGSLRARQDFLIAEAVLSPYRKGATHTPETNPMLQMVLARVRQLGAHETGHTLGLAHNFAASSLSQNNSVMDYPHPLIELDKNGKVSVSHAYAVGLGAWDKIAITYGYRQFAPGVDEAAALTHILSDADQAGEVFIADPDARPDSSAHPTAHLWDNGSDAAAELERILTVRSAALRQFGENAIPEGRPMAELEETLVPLFLLHRYATEAAIKLIGGLDYRYNLRGDGQLNPRIVSPEAQTRAIRVVLRTLSADNLTLPESLLEILPPHPPGSPRTQESFASRTGPAFDPIAAAESAADLTLSSLLNPARASRIVEYSARLRGAPGLRGLLEALSKTVANRPGNGAALSTEVARAVELRALEATIRLSVNPAASSQARAITDAHVDALLKELTVARPAADTAESAHRRAMIRLIKEYQKEPAKFTPARTIEAPPGMPIGEEEIM